MPPRLKRLSAVAVYTPDLSASEELYRLLGLRAVAPASTSAQPQGRLVMRFSEGETQLILHNDTQRQFVELTVSVEDVRNLYSHWARDPSYRWIETPHCAADEWKAVVRLPDDNVFTLLSGERIPLSAEGRGP